MRTKIKLKRNLNSLIGFEGSKRMNPKYLIGLLVVGLILVPSLSNAQCAMCRAVLESEASGNAAEGINNGIVYLMSIPYILVAGLFYFIYRRMRS
ncbi:hypothetical protein [Maribacter thermophilus]|uniref:hypothetical protein n=1 Tax=Maribacter thermophilus TaxID=1197874 RepID=UPI000A885CD0|nr:hypothetical protein [Maribacter thermophilus]